MRSIVFGMPIVSLCFALVVNAQEAVNYPKRRQYQLDRAISKDAKECLDCHRKEHPGLFEDWAASQHAKTNITCIDCHGADKADRDISQGHFEHDKTAIAGVVTPKDCSRCHPDEAKEYARSKHANTLGIVWKIDPWMQQGMNNETERISGCYTCHGSVIEIKNGDIDPKTWPNVGVGRMNPDGSKGSCTSCHTRHRFSLAEARKPEACGQCHLGPDHPQEEIYNESKHGALTSAYRHGYNWDAAPGCWTPGVDYRAPSCAACHMSGSGKVQTTHDVTERISWELQAPLTIRPEEFKPFPAKTNWKTERSKMQDVCRQCHSKRWIESHFLQLDNVVQNYNEEYFKPAKKMLDELYAKKLLTKTPMFDDEFEFEYYELWHYEGRRARMGAAMMAPDYTWWHGFYELKKQLVKLQELREQLIETGRPIRAKNFPGRCTATTPPWRKGGGASHK
ncbi:MAG: hydroxylamine oxidoreductase [Planctomycetes bacterium]|nr:hydroxylamine oxidoreductase [Planctomycetota bacterium]